MFAFACKLNHYCQPVFGVFKTTYQFLAIKSFEVKKIQLFNRVQIFEYLFYLGWRTHEINVHMLLNSQQYKCHCLK